MSKPNHHQPSPSQPQRDTPQPIPVRQIQFVGPQDGPGLSVASSVTGQPAGEKTEKRHWRLVYMPWIRAFRVTHVLPKGGGQPQTAYIPEHRVMFWVPCEDEDKPTP